MQVEKPKFKYYEGEAYDKQRRKWPKEEKARKMTSYYQRAKTIGGKSEFEEDILSYILLRGQKTTVKMLVEGIEYIL